MRRIYYRLLISLGTILCLLRAVGLFGLAMQISFPAKVSGALREAGIQLNPSVIPSEGLRCAEGSGNPASPLCHSQRRSQVR